jgi:hypothetical protein
MVRGWCADGSGVPLDSILRYESTVSEEPSVAGMTVLQTRKVLEEMYGAATLAAAISKLPPGDRARYDETIAVSWVPTRILDQVTVELGLLTGRLPESIQRSAARTSVERTFRTAWRILLRVTTDEMLVTRTPSFYSRSFSVGALTSKIPRPGVAEIVLHAWPDVSDLQIAGLAAGIEATLIVAGRQGVHMATRRTSDGAAMSATWRR